MSPALKTSKMSRFKSFGKKEAKKELLQTAETVAPVVEERPSTGSTSDDEIDAHLSAAQRAQQKLLRTVFSHPCHPSSWSETPPIRFTSDLPVVISEESSESGTWSTIYRSLLSRNAAELKLLEQSLPMWLLEFTMHNVIQTKEPVKIAFILEPWGGPEKAGLPELPSGSVHTILSRTASRFTR
jgi:WD repeat-containing protein 48